MEFPKHIVEKLKEKNLMPVKSNIDTSDNKLNSVWNNTAQHTRHAVLFDITKDFDLTKESSGLKYYQLTNYIKDKLRESIKSGEVLLNTGMLKLKEIAIKEQEEDLRKMDDGSVDDNYLRDRAI